jgi:hypothetical protein
LSVVGIVLFATVVIVEWMVLPWRYSPKKTSFWVRLSHALAASNRA